MTFVTCLTNQIAHHRVFQRDKTQTKATCVTILYVLALYFRVRLGCLYSNLAFTINKKKLIYNEVVSHYISHLQAQAGTFDYTVTFQQKVDFLISNAR